MDNKKSLFGSFKGKVSVKDVEERERREDISKFAGLWKKLSPAEMKKANSRIKEWKKRCSQGNIDEKI